MDHKIVGYTTGVFDLFHIGHLNLLRRARSLCDYLIVGVSTDELVLREKHHAPIIPYDERIQIVSALKCVDQVVPQADKDKLGAYYRIRPRFHRMFVGSDWQGTVQWQNYEHQFAPTGVEIIYLPYTCEISSSILRDRIIRACEPIDK